MTAIAKPLSRVAAALAATAAGLIVTIGSASAAGYHDYDHHGYDHASTHKNTVTKVHSSGRGPTAVTAAGSGGYANQYVDQRDSDRGKHSRYEDNGRTHEDYTYGSHNSERYYRH